jgi:secreted trypsin-like serine protease
MISTDQFAAQTRRSLLTRTTFAIALAATTSLLGCVNAEDEDDDDTELESDESEIVGGVALADGARAPFVVFLSISHGFNGITSCSGVAIGPQTILTAAHCVDDIDIDKIVVERHSPTDVGHRLTLGFAIAQKWTAHPKYSEANGNSFFDVGVIQTSVPTVPFAVAKLAPERPVEGARLIMYGFGATQYSAGDYGNLKKRVVRVTASGTKQFSTGVAGCFGDSGGPAIYRKRGKVFVAGITSRVDCASITDLAAVATYKTFINNASR